MSENENRESNTHGRGGASRGQNGGRGRGRGRNTRNRWANNKKTKSKFYGDTRDMQGHVFQTRSEQTNNSQFQDTVDQIKIYSSSNFKKEIKHLRRLFDKLELPVIPEPKPPKENIKSEEGVDVKDTTYKFKEAVYHEEIKQWIKDKRNMDETITSIYNIIWGQCSKLLRNKLYA